MQQTVSTILGGQAAPRVIAHKGKQYRCQPFKIRLKSALERRLENYHRVLLLGDIPLAPEVQALLLRGHAADVLAGRFKFGGPDYQAWAKAYDGVVGVASVLLGCTNDEAEELLAERGEEVAAMIDLTIRESLSPAQLETLRKAEEAAQKTEQPQEQADPNS